jgi:predicted NBD/HSP70 family sugar kinase
MKNPRGNKKLIRTLNRSAVLNTIKAQPSISRTDIARSTGLSAATITAITGDLIGSGLVLEKDEGDSRGGRRPILLAINPDGRYVIGIKLSENHITGVLTNLISDVVASTKLDFRTRSLDQVLMLLEKVIRQLLEEAAIDPAKLLGVGLGLAGIVDSARGVLRDSPIFGWNNAPIAERLKRSLKVDVFIDNDVNTLTINEQWFGQGQNLENFITVTVGRGVGLGIVLNGQIYLGVKGSSGEFGHTVIDPEGPLCECGKHGCLETFVSDPALLSRAQESIDPNLTSIAALISLADAGDKKAQALFADAGVILGQGVANLINVLNPEMVILSGEGVRAGDHLLTPMREAIDQHVMPGLKGDTRIQIDQWEDDAWARGAAGLVLKRLFEFPILKGGATQ